MGKIKKIGRYPTIRRKFPHQGRSIMKNLFKIMALLGLLSIQACGNNQENRNEESIRESIRRQDSLSAKDRLDRLKRQVTETYRVDSLVDSTEIIEIN